MIGTSLKDRKGCYAVTKPDCTRMFFLLCVSASFWGTSSLSAAAQAPAQVAAATPGMPFGQPIATAPPDAAIAQALKTISPAQIHADIEKLVTFKNRSTVSSMDTDLPPGTGITAAADWLFSEYTRISEACGGCLEVKRDDFMEPANPAPSFPQ